MILVFSLITVTAFVIIFFYEDEYLNDRWISRITLFVKILLLTGLFGIFIYKLLIYFSPYLDKSFNKLTKINYSEHHQTIIIKNDLSKEFELHFFKYNQKSWLRTKPQNIFMPFNSFVINKNRQIEFVFNANNPDENLIYLLHKKDNNMLWNAKLINIPVNTIKLYASDFNEKIKNINISYYSHYENILFFLTVILTGIYLMMKILQLKGYKKIILTVLVSASIICSAFGIYLDSAFLLNFQF